MTVAFKKLKKYPGLWKVDGISNIHLVTNKPRITISFSKIKKDALENTYKHENHHLDKNHKIPHISLDFPFSAIMWFISGSLWEDGVKVFDSPIVHDSISIDTTNIRNYRLQDTIPINGAQVEIIPKNYYSFGGNKGSLDNSHYAFAKVINSSYPATEYLIIPHTEIFRFYYGMSSRLCNSILMGETNKYADMSSNTSIKGNSPTLVTNKYLSRLERLVFLRALSNPAAEEGLYCSHKKIKYVDIYNLNDSENSIKPVFSIFPFNDRTDLTVAGKKICLKKEDDNGSAVWATLVTQILTCRRPFDFANPTIYCPGPRGHGQGGGNSGANDNAPPRPPMAGNTEEEEELFEAEDTPADTRLKRLALLSPSNRFPDFYTITYDFKNSNGTPNTHAGNLDDIEESEYNSIDEGDYTGDGKGNGGGDGFLEELKPPRSLIDFIRMVKVLRKLLDPEKKSGNTKYNVTTQRNTGELTMESEQISIFPNLGSPFSWYLSDLGEARKVIWVKITNPKSGKSLDLLEMELKGNESQKGCGTAMLISKSHEYITPLQITSFLKLTAYRRAWPMSEHSCVKTREKTLANKIFPLIDYHRLHHLNNVDEYDDKLILTWAKKIKETIVPYLA